MQFADLKLSAPLLRALEIEGYSVATPIQAQAIPHILNGHDVLGCAQTGTGKTAAFALPILDKLNQPQPTGAQSRKPRVLVLCPTRELATQIGAGFKAYGREVKTRYSVIFGGVGQGGQVMSIRSGVDVVIACPGRLLDLMNQGHVDLSGIETLVLDEADRMLDMGFIPDIRRIVAKIPAKRQTLMFSATMPPDIRRLADTLLRNPVTVSVTPVSAVADRIDESVYFVDKAHKPHLLAHLIKDLPMHRAIVFSRTKHGADKVVKKLEIFGIKSAAIHGNKSQNNRNRALADFKADKIGVLVATDIAARGIDIDGVTHVVNFDLTHEPETYVHRIGRTARAGASGNAVSFCDRDERPYLNAIERLIKRKVTVAQSPIGTPAMAGLKAVDAGRDEVRSGGAFGRGDGGPGRRRDGGQARDGQSGGQGGSGQPRDGQNRDGQNRTGQHRDARPAGGGRAAEGAHPREAGQAREGRGQHPLSPSQQRPHHGHPKAHAPRPAAGGGGRSGGGQRPARQGGGGVVPSGSRPGGGVRAGGAAGKFRGKPARGGPRR
jgi:ATP-dependent RNA helicase RhlE